MTAKRFTTAAAGVPAAGLLIGTKVRLCMMFVLALSLCGSVSGQTERYVSSTGDNSSHGTWSTAYTNIQDALDAAVSGDTIYVAGQTFALTNQLFWDGKNNIILTGGYAATNDLDQPGPSSPALWPTVITRAGGSVCGLLMITNVTGGTLSRVTLSGGYNYASNTVGDSYGGGLAIWNSTNLTVSSCTVSNNTVYRFDVYDSLFNNAYGGGISMKNSGVTISNCLVKGNLVVTTGGGGNNRTKSYGGGIAGPGSSVTMVDCVIANNVCTHEFDAVSPSYGGGYYTDGAAGIYCTFSNCLFVGNSAASTVRGYAYGSGDGIYGQNITLANCTVAFNTGSGYSEAWTRQTIIRNCIIWGNGRDVVSSYNWGTWVVSYNSIIGTPAPYLTTGFLSADPLFEYGYYLGAGSPAIDAGGATAAAAGMGARTTRTDGALDTGAVDMGYHYTGGIDIGAISNYCVATNGIDTNAGTAELPFRSVTKALSLAQLGSRITIGAGNYTAASGEVFPLHLADATCVRLVGAGSSGTVIDNEGARGPGVMLLEKCANVSLSGVTLTGGCVSNAVAMKTDGAFGGGVDIRNSAGVRLADCAITNNMAVCDDNTGSRFSCGGGVSVRHGVVALESCVLKNNRVLGPTGSEGRGGGLYGKSSYVTLTDCLLAENVVSRAANGTYTFGGGLYSTESPEFWLLRNCLIAANSAFNTRYSKAGQGDAIWGNRYWIENCTIAFNTGGQGLYQPSNTNTDASGRQKVIYENTITVTNSIVWANVDDIAGYSGNILLGYSDVEDGDTGTECISADPLFKSVSSGDYRLTDGSPCKDKGLNLDWVTGTLDLAGQKRLAGPFVDMGCYEVQPPFGTAVFLR